MHKLLSGVAKTTALLAFVIGAGIGAPLQASEWRVDYDHSRLEFSGAQLGAIFEGEFTEFEVEITFDPDHLETASALAVIQTASAKTGDRQIDNALPGREWFYVRQYPTATFKADSFTRTGPASYEAHGTLQIRDQAHAVILPFTLDIEDDQAVMRGALEIDRRDYEVGKGEWASDQFVGAMVQISVSLLARRAD